MQRANPEQSVSTTLAQTGYLFFHQLKTAESTVEIFLPGGGLLRNIIKSLKIFTDRLTGKNVVFSIRPECSVVTDKDGFLYFLGKNDHSEKKEIQLLCALDTVCREKNVALWQILIPSKQLNDKASLPNGLHCYQDLKFAEVLRKTADCDIKRFDAGKLLRDSGISRDELFYRTDTHWTPLAALMTSRAVAEKFFPDDPAFIAHTSVLDPDKCSPVKQGPIRLQPLGRELGYLLVPKEFSTMYIPHKSPEIMYFCWTSDIQSAPVRKHGTYQEIIIREEPVKFNYARYLDGENYPKQIIHNLSQKNGRRLLIIQDSFGLPVASFLSLLFETTILLDPRFFSVDDFIKEINNQEFDLMLYCRARNTIGEIGTWEQKK